MCGQKCGVTAEDQGAGFGEGLVGAKQSREGQGRGAETDQPAVGQCGDDEPAMSGQRSDAPNSGLDAVTVPEDGSKR